MSSDEFTLWKSFYSLEPWGSEVDNWRMGQLAATVYNSTPKPRDKSGRTPKAKLARDFYVDPYSEKQAAVDLSDEQKAFLKARKANKATRKNG